MSCLASTYLDGYDGTDLAGPTVPNAPAPGEVALRNPDMITLPGGVTMPRSTFYLLLALVAAAALYLYLKRKNKG